MNDAKRIHWIVCLLIGTVRGERVESIGYSDNPRQSRNLLVLESVGVATSVERLVVQFDARQHLLQLFHRPQNVRALGGVSLHDLELFRSQSAGLFQDRKSTRLNSSHQIISYA